MLCALPQRERQSADFFQSASRSSAKRLQTLHRCLFPSHKNALNPKLKSGCAFRLTTYHLEIGNALTMAHILKELPFILELEKLLGNQAQSATMSKLRAELRPGLIRFLRGIQAFFRRTFSFSKRRMAKKLRALDASQSCKGKSAKC
jgi:hypothetical protein